MHYIPHIKLAKKFCTSSFYKIQIMKLRKTMPFMKEYKQKSDEYSNKLNNLPTKADKTAQLLLH